MCEERTTHSDRETRVVGKSLGESIAEPAVITLVGSLGAGKTTLTKGICAGLGVKQPVTSPSFTLINEYKGRLPIFHFDFYRLHDQNEAYEIGWEEYIYGPGVCIIEWADKVLSLLPGKRIDIKMETAANRPEWRKLVIRYL